MLLSESSHIKGAGGNAQLSLRQSHYRSGALIIFGVTTYRNGPGRTETDLRKYRNGLLWVPKRTGTDFSGYRNGPEQTSAHTERTSVGTRKGRAGYDRNEPNKVMYVLVGGNVGRYVCM